MIRFWEFVAHRCPAAAERGRSAASEGGGWTRLRRSLRPGVRTGRPGWPRTSGTSPASAMGWSGRVGRSGRGVLGRRGIAALIAHHPDEVVCLEAAELLLGLARRSDTTEVPAGLCAAWGPMADRLASFGSLGRRAGRAVAAWYRMAQDAEQLSWPTDLTENENP